MKKRKLKIEFAGSVAIDSLQPYVDIILKALASVFNDSGIECAFVSDRSTISDFLDSEETGETRDHPMFLGELVNVITTDTDGNREKLKRVSECLGVDVGVYDYIYEVAIKLRKKEESC